MKTQDVFPNRFVKAEDLTKDTPVTIESVILEEVYNPGTNEASLRPVVYFEKASKPMLLNKTNWMAIADAFGDDSDGWKGGKIVLYRTTTHSPEGVVPCIRVRVPGKVQDDLYAID